MKKSIVVNNLGLEVYHLFLLLLAGKKISSFFELFRPNVSMEIRFMLYSYIPKKRNRATSGVYSNCMMMGKRNEPSDVGDEAMVFIPRGRVPG